MMMFKSVSTMWRDALQCVIVSGDLHESRNGPAFERVGWSGTLANVDYSFLCNARRALDPAYAAAELLWYLSWDDHTEMIEHYAPQYKRFAEKNGRAYGAYGKRVANNVKNHHQINLAIKMLQENPETRQCVITLWRPDDLLAAGTVKDLPCTLTWQFVLRAGALHMICSMRSNDLWLGFPYDVFVNTCILRLMAGQLGVRPGTYTHHVGSIHLYAKDERKVAELPMDEEWPHAWGDDAVLRDISEALYLERHARFGTDATRLSGFNAMSPMMRDMIRAVSWRAGHSQSFESLAFQRAAQMKESKYADHRGS